MKVRKTGTRGLVKLVPRMPHRFKWQPIEKTPIPESGLTHVKVDASLPNHLTSDYGVPITCMSAAVSEGAVPVVDIKGAGKCVAVEHVHWLRDAAVCFADGSRAYDQYDLTAYQGDCRSCGAGIQVCMLRHGPSLAAVSDSGFAVDRGPGDE